MPKPNTGLFTRLNIITIIAVYLLILVGGIVRSTGSGMGCPDWPKCFGEYVPPTAVSSLPSNYQEIYLNKRIAKNLRVSSMFEKLGFVALAKQMTEDESVFVEQEFNVVKTWIEYLNRLLGVIVGFLIVLCLGSSLRYWKLDKPVVWASIGALVLVMFQGWIGSIVVSTNLLPGMITFHMLLAIGLIILLIWLRLRTETGEVGQLNTIGNRTKVLLIVSMVLFVVQILLGTQVREAIDEIAHTLGESLRSNWIEELGLTFYIHRSYSLVLMALYLYLASGLLKELKSNRGVVALVMYVLLGMIVLEILSGAIMTYFALPRFVQPIHLTLALAIFGAEYYLYLLINRRSAVSA